MRFLQGVRDLVMAIVKAITLKFRPTRTPSVSTSEAERLDRLRNPSKYLGRENA